MSAHDETHYLPKEPLDLPRPPVSLPTELPKEIPAHVSHADIGDTEKEDAYREVKTLLSWHAPGRPYRQRKREFYVNSVLILLALEVIIFLFHEYALMAVVLSVGFLSFALSIIRPHNFRYKISTEGVTVEDHFVLWKELYDFYFKEYNGEDVLILRTEAYFPGELVLTLGDIHKDQIKHILLPYLPYREYVQPTFMEKSGDWLTKTFPLERS